MTDDQILEVVRAHKEGKKIQAKRIYGKPMIFENLDWSEVNAHWNFAEFDYRVSPEPRKPRHWWIRESADLFDCAYKEPKSSMVHVIEVIE